MAGSQNGGMAILRFPSRNSAIPSCNLFNPAIPQSILQSCHSAILQYLDRLLQSRDLVLRGMDDRPSLLQRGRRPVFVIQPDAPVAAHLDDDRVHRLNVQMHEIVGWQKGRRAGWGRRNCRMAEGRDGRMGSIPSCDSAILPSPINPAILPFCRSAIFRLLPPPPRAAHPRRR